MGFGDHVILNTEPFDFGDGTSDGYDEGIGADLVVVDSEEDDEVFRNIRNVVGQSRIRGNGITVEKEGVLNGSGFEELVDLSQANALNFVDQFVSSNRVEYSPIVQPGDLNRKVSPDSRSSGSQTIARYIMSRTKERKCRAFEWDDSDELEEGDSLGQEMNARSDSGRDTNNEKVEGKNCVLGLIGKYAERKTDQLNLIASNHQLYKCIGKTIDLETHDVGFSTQIAAEAMEALSDDHPKLGCLSPWSCFQEYQSDVGKKLVDSGKLLVHDSNFSILEGISMVPKRKRSKARRGTNKLIWKHCNFRGAAEFPETAKNPRRELPTKDLSDNISISADQSLARKFIVCEQRNEPVVEQENHQSPLTTNDSKLRRTREEMDGHREGRNAVAESPLITYRRRKTLGKQQVQENSWINWNEMREDGSTKTIFRVNELGESRNTMAGSPLITYRRKKSDVKRQAQGNAQMNWNGMTDSRSRRHICRSGEHGATESPIITYKRKMKQSEVLNDGRKFSSQSSEVDMNNLQSQEKKTSVDNIAKTFVLHLHTQGSSKGKKACRSLPRLTRTVNNDDKSKESKMEQWHEELVRAVAPDSAHNVISKDIRTRRNVRVVSVLFSQHLDDNILKQQKRISERMRIPVASCLTDATHFIADRFARTKNMLEAIAVGKPVVTHLWLESCCQVGCLVDEKNYMLRDAKKEKEFGFSLPVSLSRALQHPLLKGWRVLVTPNVKPNRDIILSLVKVARGEVWAPIRVIFGVILAFVVAHQRNGSQIAEHDQIEASRNPAQILILSCEEDYAICLPFLEQGAAAYSPELILNGTIIQKLEFDRHQLFRHFMKQ